MSSVETGQMSVVETGQMSASEARQMSSIDRRNMYSIETGLMSSAGGLALSRRKMFGMGPEWSPGFQNRALSIQPCLESVSKRSSGQAG